MIETGHIVRLVPSALPTVLADNKGPEFDDRCRQIYRRVGTSVTQATGGMLVVEIDSDDKTLATRYTQSQLCMRSSPSGQVPIVVMQHGSSAGSWSNQFCRLRVEE